MNQTSNFYCRLENFCFIHTQNQQNTVKEKSLFLEPESAYVSYFDNLESLKEHILKTTKAWLIRHSCMNENAIYQENQSNNVDINKVDTYSDVLKYPKFMIYNHWGDWSTIGICNKGWFVGGNNFQHYMINYAVEIYGIPGYARALEKIPNQQITFIMDEVTEVDEIYLLTNELVNLELENFLDRKEITEEIKREVYYPEMVKRGYIDIIGEKE